MQFLAQLQQHLENVQVFLGTIEGWLAEPEDDLAFLNDLFKTDLSPDSFVVEETYKNCDTCGVDYENRIMIQITIQLKRRYDRTHTRFTTCDQCLTSKYHRIILQLIKNAPITSTKKPFNIGTKDDRKKLTKFVEFLDMYA